MSGLNKVTLIGNLGQDPEITAANNDLLIAKFSIATSDARPDAQGNVKTEWHRVVAFGKTAEYMQKYITKGATVCVEGRIQYGKYENKDGVTVYTTDIICNNLINLTKREGNNSGGNSGGYQNNSQPQQQQQSQSQFAAPQQQAPQQFNVGADLTNDDLPY